MARELRFLTIVGVALMALCVALIVAAFVLVAHAGPNATPAGTPKPHMSCVPMPGLPAPFCSVR